MNRKPQAIMARNTYHCMPLSIWIGPICATGNSTPTTAFVYSLEKYCASEEQGQRAYQGIDTGQAVRGQSHDRPHSDASGESTEQGHEKRLACPVC